MDIQPLNTLAHLICKLSVMWILLPPSPFDRREMEAQLNAVTSQGSRPTFNPCASCMSAQVQGARPALLMPSTEQAPAQASCWWKSIFYLQSWNIYSPKVMDLTNHAQIIVSWAPADYLIWHVFNQNNFINHQFHHITYTLHLVEPSGNASLRAEAILPLTGRQSNGKYSSSPACLPGQFSESSTFS